MKKFLFGLLYATGLTRFAAWCNRNRVAFLCWHGVTERPNRSPNDPKALHVNHRRFTAQLDFLARHYRVISLREYVKANRERRTLPPYSVVLTFDDGFRNFFTTAAPLLAERRMPATVFLITDKIAESHPEDRNGHWTEEDDSGYLSWQEIRSLKEKHRIDFGSHTCSHSGLLNLTEEETEQELRHSYRALVENLALQEPTLSYPKGQYSQKLAERACKLGYACAVTTDRGQNEQDHDLFTLGRCLIGDNDDLAPFAVRVSGLRSWLVAASSFLRLHDAHGINDSASVVHPVPRVDMKAPIAHTGPGAKPLD